MISHISIDGSLVTLMVNIHLWGFCKEGSEGGLSVTLRGPGGQAWLFLLQLNGPVSSELGPGGGLGGRVEVPGTELKA